MNIEIIIRRQRDSRSAPYTQTFLYTGDGKLTVADFLSELNTRAPLLTADGKEAEPITYSSSCGEKKCGACAMLINGIPRLACSLFLCNIAKKGKIELAPLSKFPVIRDLQIDRKKMFTRLKEMKVWLSQNNNDWKNGDRALQYDAGQCLMCGCCLEICPNYTPKSAFSGAASMIHAFKVLEQNIADSHLQTIKENYGKYFFAGCSQSLSCMKVCPLGLPLDKIQSRANHHLRKKSK